MRVTNRAVNYDGKTVFTDGKMLYGNKPGRGVRLPSFIAMGDDGRPVEGRERPAYHHANDFLAKRILAEGDPVKMAYHMQGDQVVLSRMRKDTEYEQKAVKVVSRKTPDVAFYGLVNVESGIDLVRIKRAKTVSYERDELAENNLVLVKYGLREGRDLDDSLVEDLLEQISMARPTVTESLKSLFGRDFMYLSPGKVKVHKAGGEKDEIITKALYIATGGLVIREVDFQNSGRIIRPTESELEEALLRR